MGKSRALSIVVATAAATLVTGMTSAPAGAASTYDPAPAKSGAAWLSDQVTDGLVHNEQYDFDDVGLSIDVALGLDAAGKKPTVVKAITKAVAKNVAFYTAFAPSVYAGPTAKAAVLALSQDKNPHAFGGVDLVAQLEARVATAAPITGRIEDAFDPTDEFGGDYANVIGQAYAAQALSLVGSAKATSATAFLLAQQCDKGYFRQYFTADKTRTDQSCQGAPRAERGASTDATALAVLALQDVKGSKAKGAVKKAVAWLEDTPAGQRWVHRHREGRARRQHQQHRPGRLGAGRGRGDEAGRARGRRRPVRSSRGRRQPVHRQGWRSTSAPSPTTSTPETRRATRASPRRPATSGVGRRPRPCRCCAGRRAPRSRLHGDGSGLRSVAALVLQDQADRRGPGRAGLRDRRRQGRVRLRGARPGPPRRRRHLRSHRRHHAHLHVWLGTQHRDVTVRVTG